MKIIVVSNGSDDGTDEIIQSTENPKAITLRQEPRQGKTAALNNAGDHSSGKIHLFSDANSIYEGNALRYLMENSYDP